MRVLSASNLSQTTGQRTHVAALPATGETRLSEIKSQQLQWACSPSSLNMQVPATGKTKVQGLLLGRVYEPRCWRHPLFSGGGAGGGGVCLHVFPLTDLHPKPPEKGTARDHCCCLRSCQCSACLPVSICVYTRMHCTPISKCPCLLGIHGQSCYRLDLGHRPAAASPLPGGCCIQLSLTKLFKFDEQVLPFPCTRSRHNSPAIKEQTLMQRCL